MSSCVLSGSRVKHLRLRPGVDQADYGIQKVLAVSGECLGKYDQVDAQSLVAPVGVGLDYLTHQLKPGLLGYPQQYHGQVAGDAVGPQAGLSLAVAGDQARAGAQTRIGINEGPGHPHEQLGVGLSSPQRVEQDLAVRPRYLEHPIRKVVVVVLVHKGQGSGGVLPHAPDDVQLHGLPGPEMDGAADGHGRVQDRTFAARQRPWAAQGGGGDRRPAATQEPGPIRLEGDLLAHRRLVDDHAVKEAGPGLFGRLGPSQAQDGRLFRHDLGLDEQAVKCGLFAGVEAVEDHRFGITGNLQIAPVGREVRDDQPANFHVVLR